jgi:hypothetical protein
MVADGGHRVSTSHLAFRLRISPSPSHLASQKWLLAAIAPRLRISTSCFAFVFRLRVSTSCFAFVFRLRVSPSCFDFVFRLRISPSCFAFVFWLRVSPSRLGFLFHVTHGRHDECLVTRQRDRPQKENRAQCRHVSQTSYRLKCCTADNTQTFTVYPAIYVYKYTVCCMYIGNGYLYYIKLKRHAICNKGMKKHMYEIEPP